MAMMREARAAKAAARKANGHDAGAAEDVTSVPLDSIPGKKKRGPNKKKSPPAVNDPRLLLAGELIKLVNKLLDD